VNGPPGPSLQEALAGAGKPKDEPYRERPWPREPEPVLVPPELAVAIEAEEALEPSRERVLAALATFSESLAPRSARAYRKDLERFAEWFGASLLDALSMLVSLPEDEVSVTVSRWIDVTLVSGVTLSTVRRRVAAMRYFLKAAGLSVQVGVHGRSPPTTSDALRYGGVLSAFGYALHAYADLPLGELFRAGDLECEPFTNEL
jgi:hypothetical protein